MKYKIDSFLDNRISEEFKKANDKERLNHKSSGKLSASMLGQPLQWQVLKILGVEGREIDGYTLRKFARGKDIEKWVIPYLNPTFTQEFVEYRNCVGYADAIVKAKWDEDYGVLPVEVKSVSNMKFKRMEFDEEADRGHRLQACLYALALKTDYFGITYIASDDYRVKTLIYETKSVAPEVDNAITLFEEQMKKKEIPKFEAIEKWQGDIKYNNYPLYAGMTEDELKEKSKELFK